MRNLRSGLWVVLAAAVAAPATAQMHGAQPIEVPLSVKGGRLAVPVQTAHGAVLEFYLSTANVVTVLTESVATRLGNEAGLTMGGVPVPLEDRQTVPDKALTLGGTSFDGMISGNMLSQFDVLVDVPGGRLVLKPIGRTVSWEGVALSDPMPLRVFHGAILNFDVELNGHPYGATLDLGASTLVVNGKAGTGAGLKADDEGMLGIAGRRVEGLPVRVLDLPAFERWDPDNKGFVMVGAPLAYECAIAISWVHQEMRVCAL